MSKKPKSKKMTPNPDADPNEQPFGPNEIQKAKVKHVFSPAELQAFGAQLSDELQRRDELEEQKKNATAEFSNKIKISDATASSLANKIRSGYEMVDEDVRVEFFPKRKIKKLYNIQSGELLREEPMDWNEMQIGLPLDQDPSQPGHD